MGNISISEERNNNIVGGGGTGNYNYSYPSVNKKGVQAIMGRVNMVPGSINSSYLSPKQNRKVQEAQDPGSTGRLYRGN